jgi:hypothetical protein
VSSNSEVIAPRRSIALFATLSIVMTIASYILLVIVAVLCVYLPGLLIATLESANAQLAILFLGGILIAGAILWSAQLLTFGWRWLCWIMAGN